MRIAFINEYLAYDVLKGGPASIFKPAKAQIEQDVNSWLSGKTCGKAIQKN